MKEVTVQILTAEEARKNREVNHVTERRQGQRGLWSKEGHPQEGRARRRVATNFPSVKATITGGLQEWMWAPFSFAFREEGPQRRFWGVAPTA